jgi:hypothetical protein
MMLENNYPQPWDALRTRSQTSLTDLDKAYKRSLRDLVWSRQSPLANFLTIFALKSTLDFFPFRVIGNWVGLESYFA